MGKRKRKRQANFNEVCGNKLFSIKTFIRYDYKLHLQNQVYFVRMRLSQDLFYKHHNSYYIQIHVDTRWSY